MDGHPNAQSVFMDAISDHLNVVRAITLQQELLKRIARTLAETLHRGNKILWCGNGGSAADSQHMAAEIVGRFRRERRGLPSIALTTDTSVLTAVANDYGYDCVFSRQVEALATSGDVLVGLSTSGKSPNVVKALIVAKEMNLVTVALTGQDGGKLAFVADLLFAAASRDTARIQEAHGLVGHLLCDWMELAWISAEGQSPESKTEFSTKVDRGLL
jgi:D-sedoheptulose 7-phosphate isomerase